MTANDGLTEFVKDALSRGISRSDIEGSLLKAGWTKEQVREALAGYASIEFPIPVPCPRPYVSAKEAFLYLVLFSALYISAFNLGSVLFHFIEQAFPDPTDPGWKVSNRSDAIRWSVSSLIVAFPVFLLITKWLSREHRRAPIMRESKVRRWLTYLTLFVTAVVLISDFIVLVNGMLGGELTLRFILKVGVVSLIAGTAFWYYLWDLRQEEVVTETRE
jgi:hypothetical protein